MKKTFTLSLFLLTLTFFAQSPPVIESTYYPVRNTSIKQVWDTTPGSMSIPAQGPNKIWDYRFSNNQFLNVVDTFRFKMLDPITTPYKQYFPSATHACFIRTPFQNFADSLFGYFKVDYAGLHNLGGFNIKGQYDSTYKINPIEFYAPPVMSYLYNMKDTSKFVAYANNYNYLGKKAKIKGRKTKNFTYSGYGTLRLPNGDYSNVALVKETYASLDSIFVDFLNNNNYTYATLKTSSSVNYQFLRNNTFGSAYLMSLTANPSNTQVSYGWYTLPVDFGSISGTVFTNTLETTPVTAGKAYLYRENSNFSKNDILAKTNLTSAGVYKFDSIPFGEYRIAIRPDTLLYPNANITYFGDTTNWIDATPIITTNTLSSGNKIHMQYHSAPAGINKIQGQLNLNLGIFKANGSVFSSNPIPSIGVVVKKNPGSSTARMAVSDTTGKFDINNLDDGTYSLFVDIPGLHHAGTYSFAVSGGNILSGLDFVVGTDSIHPSNSIVGIKTIKAISSSDNLTAYPNPYTSNTTITFTLPSSAHVLLEVFDVLGKKIQTLDNSDKNAGNFKYNFSAKTLNGTAGIYIVKLKAGNVSRVIKIVEQ